MTWEKRIEVLVHNGGFWLSHINYVTLWVLLSLALIGIALRLMLREIVLRRLAQAEESATRHSALRIILVVVLLAFSSLSGYMAVRPDPVFYETIAGSSFEAGDCRRAVEFYSPLVAWGSENLKAHLRLADCELQLGLLEDGLQTLVTARRLPGGDTPSLRLWAARALAGLGQWSQAAQELETALLTADPGPERAQIERELEMIRQIRAGVKR